MGKLYDDNFVKKPERGSLKSAAKAVAIKGGRTAITQAGGGSQKRLEGPVAPPATARPPVRVDDGDDEIRFLMVISVGLSARLEEARSVRGLRSRAETIRVLLEEALGK